MYFISYKYLFRGKYWEELHIFPKDSITYFFDGAGKDLNIMCIGAVIWDKYSGNPKHRINVVNANTGEIYDITNNINTTYLSYTSSSWSIVFYNDNSLWNTDFKMTLNWQISETPDLSMGYPHCQQLCPEWCWATVISQLRDFLYMKNPYCINCCENNTNKDCDTDQCGEGATVSQMIQVINKVLPNYNYLSINRALEIPEISFSLSKMYPVLVGISWHKGGGHFITVIGCCNFCFNLNSYFLIHLNHLYN